MTQLPTSTPWASPEAKPFWDAAAEDRLCLPVCDSCGEAIWYPRLFCPLCHSEAVTWTDASGEGTIYSFTVVERGQGKWKEHSPYVIAYVELAEGPRILTNLIDIDPDSIVIGQPVTVRFDHAAEGGAVVRFGPA